MTEIEKLKAALQACEAERDYAVKHWAEEAAALSMRLEAQTQRENEGVRLLDGIVADLRTQLADTKRRAFASEAEAAGFLQDCEKLAAQLAALEQWTHQYGAALNPSGKWTDSFGDGMRAAKEQVASLLKDNT